MTSFQSVASRSALWAVLFGLALPVGAQGNAPEFEAGKALGNSSKAALEAAIRNTGPTGAKATIQATIPGYTDSPSATAYAGSSDLSAAAAAQRQACATAPSDPACAGSNLAGATRSYPTIQSSDPALAGAGAVANPSTVIGSLSTVYSACTDRTETTTRTSTDIQSCNEYPLRALNNACTKTRSVTVDWKCNDPRTVYGPFRNTGFQPPWQCELQDSYWDWSCPAGTSGPAWYSDRSGYYCGSNSTSARATQLTSADGSSYWTCPDGGGGSAIVYDPTYLSLPAGYYCAAGGVADTGADWTEFYYNWYEAATPQVSETWINPCASYEARVPPGALPPDGENPATGTIGAVPDVNKCYRTNSLCTDATPTARVINDYTVTRSCWGYTNTFDCVLNDPRSDCNQPRIGDCVPNGDRVCVEYDTDLSPAACVHYQRFFTCQTSTTTTQPVQDCGTQTFTSAGMSFDTGYPPDTDFARTVALLEGAREAGKYLDPNSLQIFKGYDSRCSKKLFGLVNCCNRSGGGASSLLANLSLGLGAVSSVGKAAFSTYTYDSLFTSSAPDLAIKGFESLFGTGYSSALAGLLNGGLSVEQFVTALVPSYWTIALIAIQIAGMLAECSDAEKEVALKRDQRLCVPLGDYCSSCIRIFGRCVRCVEKTQSFCCFNSRLARIVNEQGRAQIGKGWGSAQSPDCSGFTPDQLQSLDFAAMDLSEFYAEIAPTLPNADALRGNASDKAQTCYLGAGKC